MNAPHPIRAQYGGLALAADPEPLPSMSEAISRLDVSLDVLDQIAESALAAAHHLERATIAGAGLRYDYMRLEAVATKLAEVARRTEAARARLSSKLMGVP